MTETPLPLRLLGGHVVDPATGTDRTADLFVDADGVHMEAPAGSAAWPAVDVSGKVVTPAFVEIHAHLREPGGEESETVASGLRAAREGGYGHVVAMANTTPTNDDPEVTALLLGLARESGIPVRLHPVSAVTRGLAGVEPAPWRDQIAAGCVALSDDGKPVADHDLLANLLAACEEMGVRYLSHAEVPELFVGVVHEGESSRALGLPGIPAACESRAVEAEIAVAERLGAAIHFCHLSTAAAVEAVRAARERGVRVTGEATPHHLVLTDGALLERGPDPLLKMNPPLRTGADRAAVRQALRDGLLGAVATDHAPHAARLKARGIHDCPFGVIGMETAFPVVHQALVVEEGWPLALLVDRLTRGAADCLGLPFGRLFEGPPAVTILDADAPWTLRVEELLSRSRNCPFDGWTGLGRVVATLLGDSLVEHLDRGD